MLFHTPCLLSKVVLKIWYTNEAMARQACCFTPPVYSARLYLKSDIPMKQWPDRHVASQLLSAQQGCLWSFTYLVPQQGHLSTPIRSVRLLVREFIHPGIFCDVARSQQGFLQGNHHSGKSFNACHNNDFGHCTVQDLHSTDCGSVWYILG